MCYEMLIKIGRTMRNRFGYLVLQPWNQKLILNYIFKETF